ncbi:MFS transporter [Pseudonocardia sp. CA-107938]|uniref:MFS transporter n=1 Tax=Pseudonocardia sp. CA-107938 TaxID=3240021 RepID=UPI003D8D697C
MSVTTTRRVSPVPFAVAAGLAVADVYYASPLLATMAAEFRVEESAIGAVVTVTQVGYALGLALVAPLGDRLDRRRLVGAQSGLMAVALLAVALAPSIGVLLVALSAVGVLAVLAQVLVAAAASLADPGDRGRVVGVVTSGIVLGILLARTVAGALAEVAGWRSVYLVSAVATLLVGAVLLRTVPHSRPSGIPYPRLVVSTLRLFAEVPVLRARAALAFLVFMALNVLLAPMVLELAAHGLSTGEIGLFGLAGVAGVLGATRAGRRADQRVTLIGLLVMLVAWLPVALLPWSLAGLVVGVLLFDYGLQSVHVASQGLIYRTRPEAQSRLTAAYMLLYSAGSAVGAITATAVHAAAGWTGVSVLGAAVIATALLLWALTRGRTP